MGKIFISYSYHDKSFVDWLVERLAKEDISVWYDKNEINVGDSLTKKIEKGIKSSSFIIIVLSKSGVKSKWVNYEFNTALVYSAQKQGVRILPVLIDDTDIPPNLSSIRYADFTKNKDLALQELIQTIRQEDKIIIKPPNWDELNPASFENLVYDLLIAEKLQVTQQTSSKDQGFDFLANFHNVLPGNIVSKQKWLVEAKFYKNSKLSVKSIVQFYGVAKLSDAHAILFVTNSDLTNAAKDFIANRIEDLNVLVWDTTILSDLLTKNDNIRKNYFTTHLIAKDVNVKIFDTELTKINKMISDMKDCPEGKEGWKDYENICINILNYLFVPPLKKPKIQSRTESGLDIRDALYPNRCDHPNWQFIRSDYDAKYIVVEFKNYSANKEGSEIDKEVVNQVRNYLKQTIGRIAFICSKKKPNSSGIEAQKQAFIEDNKLILFLNNEQLIEMLMRKYQNEEPSDIILDLIDEFNLNFG
jgi:HJR/Mrr/RecB family endonuclease